LDGEHAVVELGGDAAGDGELVLAGAESEVGRGDAPRGEAEEEVAGGAVGGEVGVDAVVGDPLAEAEEGVGLLGRVDEGVEEDRGRVGVGVGGGFFDVDEDVGGRGADAIGTWGASAAPTIG
jgi:hypothetical protein